MSDALLKEVEWHHVINFFEQSLLASIICLGLSGACGIGVAMGVVPLLPVVMFFGLAVVSLVIGLCITVVKWYFWRRRWGGDGQ